MTHTSEQIERLAAIRLSQGDERPYDLADDESMPEPGDWATRAARGVIADMRDRRTIKWGFNNVDEDVRREIVASVATIIRLADSLAEGMRREGTYLGDHGGKTFYSPPDGLYGDFTPIKVSVSTAPAPSYAEGLEAAATVVMALRSTVEDPSWNDALDEAVAAIRAKKEAG